MKIRKGFKVSLWLLFFLPLIPITSKAGVFPCEGPTDLVQVTVKQLSESPPTYSYSVKNLSKSTIFIFALGDSDHDEMQIIDENIPKTFISPKGWESGHVFKDESIYMLIFWKTLDPMSKIAPGQSLSGFTVEMPPKKEGPLGDIYGIPVKPLDMKQAPFSVYLQGNDRTCLWGRVHKEK